jgi:hypothetical protein
VKRHGRAINWRDADKADLRPGDFVVGNGFAIPVTGGGPRPRLSFTLAPADLGRLESFVKKDGARAKRATRADVIRRALAIGLRQMDRERTGERQAVLGPGCNLPVLDLIERTPRICGAPATTTHTIEGITFSACKWCAESFEETDKARLASLDEMVPAKKRGGARG